MDLGHWLFVASASFLGCFFFVLGGLYLALRYVAPLFAVGLRENIEDLHRAKKGTPTMGGLVFGVALFLVMGMVFFYTRDIRLYALLSIWLIFMALGCGMIFLKFIISGVFQACKSGSRFAPER
jgi:UDP-N-acetylmuramyl pentapeptide phosphotransferase/UDP-N-acetylglucosamine-1-phosphate transferase